MKFVATTLSALIASSLMGCGPVTPDEEIDTYVRQEAAKLATQQQQLDRTELEQALLAAKQRDPNVTDVYYTVNEQGERELNIVRTTDAVDGGTSGAETFTYALLGMGAAMWMANAMSTSNMASYGSSPSSSFYSQNAKKRFNGTKEENDKRRTVGSSGYVAHTNAKITNGVYSSARNGGFSSKGGSVSSSRAAFGGSGARGGSVGG